MKVLKYGLCFILLVSCGITASVDYDKQTDFTQYKTYNYFNDIESGLSELDLKRFTHALDSAMQIKGFQISDTPDFLIDIQSEEFQANSGNAVGVGVGGTGGNVGVGISVGFPIRSSNLNRQITLDFVDKDGKTLFWQAVSEYRFSPNAKPSKRESLLKAVVDKMLAKYPPKK